MIQNETNAGCVPVDPKDKIDITPSEGAADIYNWLIKQKSQEMIDSSFLEYESNADDFVALLPPDGKILELGSGIGRTLNYFYNLGFKVSGVDISSESVNKAKLKLPQVKIENLDIKDMEFEEPLDGVYERLSLMNLPKSDILKTFQKIYNALKSGGLFQCSFEIREPQHSQWYYYAMTKKIMFRGEEATLGQFIYLSYFLEMELINALKDANFKIIKPYLEENPEANHDILTVLCQK